MTVMSTKGDKNLEPQNNAWHSAISQYKLTIIITDGRNVNCFNFVKQLGNIY